MISVSAGVVHGFRLSFGLRILVNGDGCPCRLFYWLAIADAVQYSCSFIGRFMLLNWSLIHFALCWVILDFLCNLETLENVSEHIAQGKGSGPD